MNDVSGHLPVFMVYDLNCELSKTVRSEYYRRVITDQLIIALKNELASQNWESIYLLCDVDAAFNAFLDIFITLYNKHCPIKKCTIRKHIKTPWITKGLANSCKKKNVLYRQFLRYRTSETEHIKHK